MATKRFLAIVCFRTAATLALLALFSPVTQAQQVQLSYFKNYFVTGDYVVGGVSLGGKTGAVSSSINFSGVPCTSGPGLFAGVIPCSSKGAQPADVIAAFLYWQTIESTAPCSPQCGSSGNGSFNGSANTFSGVELGNPTVAACAASGAGTQSKAYARTYRADILRFLPINNSTNVRVGNGTQTFTLSSSPSSQFVGASLVVVYRLVAPGNPRIAPLRSVVIYDGTYTATPGAGDLDQTMGGFYQASKNPAAKMTHIVGNGKEGDRETITVNGSIPSGQVGTPIDGDQGSGWDVDTFSYNLAANASSVETKAVLSSDCLSWAAIITSVNVQDSDFDGIPDIGEQYGLNFNPGVRYDGVVPLPSPAPAPTPATFGTCQQYPSTCVNLPKMGANPLVPDIFVQVDWMYDLTGTPNSDGSQNPPHSHNPQIAALNMVGGVFKAHGINIHFDVGSDNPLAPYCQAANSATIGPCNYQSQKSPYIVPAAYAHGGNGINEAGNYLSVEGPSQTLLCPNALTTAQMTACAFPNQSNLYSVLGWKFGLDAIRDGDLNLGLPQLFRQDEKDTVHYALFGHALAATTPFSFPEAGSISGIADHPGGDILVTLGLWRSDNAAFDQVGTMLEQAGTLMHELGHNLGLSHGGWSDTPNCMPNYASVMNYLYQVAGLTDAKGNENIDYSYGLLLPLFENALSVKIPMGIQLYRVRYFGPLNSKPNSPLANTPGQASQAYCTTGFASEPGQSYVRLEWPSISTPDWSNGTVPSGTKLGPLDINFDATTGNNPQLITNETFSDSPDWISLNLQQVSARPNADGFSSNAELAQVGLSQLGLSQLGLSQLGLSQLGLSQLGLSQLGLSQLGLSQLGLSDPGTAALGQDQDVNAQQYHASGGGVPPTVLTAIVTTTEPNPANPNPGGTGNALTWVGDPNAVAFEYNIYRCNASAVPGCTPAVLIGSNTGSPVTTAYTDFVDDFVDAGATCPDTKGGVTNTCYNTNYTYAVTEIAVLTPGVGGPESGLSNASSMEVNHLFVMGNITPTSVIYGMANPVITTNVYGNGSVTGETCFYTDAASPNAKVIPQNVVNAPYPVYCTGPATVSTTVGVTYNAAYLTFAPSTLTITPLAITVTAVNSTKVYDSTPAAQVGVVPTVSPSTLPYGDSLVLAETYDNPNVGNAHVMSPSPIAAGSNTLVSNYNPTYKTISTGVITQAPASVTPNLATKVYGTSDPTFTGTLTGFYAADGVTAIYSRTAGETVLGSPYTISATLSANPVAPAAGLSNYNITYKTANFTITPANASVTPNANQHKVYGQPDPGLTGMLSGFLASDNVTATYTRAAGETVGAYSISATLSPSGVLSNYNITYNTANFTITPATLTGTTQPVAYVYGAVLPVSTVVYTGFVNSDSAMTVTFTGTLSCVSTAVANSPVGPYTIGCSGQSAAPNYTINYVGNTLSITPAPLTGTSQNAAATFGAPISALTALYGVFVNGDGPSSLTGTLGCTTTAVAGSPAGMYPVTCTGQSSPNYNITYNNTGVLTISDTVDLSALSLTGVNYGSNTPATPIFTGSALQLANNVGDVTASAWLPVAIPVSQGFTTTFHFNVSPAENGPDSIGDGFAFVIQGVGNQTLGMTGGGAYIGYAAIAKSIAIEFDTYSNSDFGDPEPSVSVPSGSHIAIQSLGSSPNISYHNGAGGNPNATLGGGPFLRNFADGTDHYATITYDGTSTLTLSLDGNAVTTATLPNPLATFLGLGGGPAYIGFTAATGGANDTPDITSWTWDYTNQTSAP